MPSIKKLTLLHVEDLSRDGRVKQVVPGANLVEDVLRCLFLLNVEHDPNFVLVNVLTLQVHCALLRQVSLHIRVELLSLGEPVFRAQLRSPVREKMNLHAVRTFL